MRCIASAMLLVVAVGALRAAAEPFFDARVVAVIDGDTIDVRVDGESRRIRLAGIDAPERGQPWSKRARQALAARVGGKPVRINALTTDRYGRTVGEVYADDVCVGCELVREGHVWVYRYFTDDPVLLELEADARAHRRGLWGLPESERVEPRRWRTAARRQRERSATSSAAKRESQPTFACGTKQFCDEMASCAEARRYLSECGMTSLDGDGDGEPCETRCGASSDGSND